MYTVHYYLVRRGRQKNTDNCNLWFFKSSVMIVHVLNVIVACKQALPLKMARGRNVRAWYLVIDTATP